MQTEKLTLNSSFKFACHKGLQCYTKCCSNINILLTPYDVLRMKKRLNMSAEDFLSEYTIFYVNKDVGFPTVQLKMADDAEKRCPFVNIDGCAIYDARPWSCRIYPLGLASSKEENEEFYFFINEPHCLGFNEDKEWTINEWENNQGIKIYNEMNEEFKDITLNPKLQKLTQEEIPSEPNLNKLEMAFMACYNLDKFKTFIFESKFLKLFDIKKQLIENIRTDEVELLKFGFRWVKFILFGEDTIKIKNRILEQAKKRHQSSNC